MMKVRFVCGHTQTAKGDEVRLACNECGEHRVTAVAARAPRFTGHCRGPHATFKALKAKAVSLAGER